jgi:hypothetical protein
MKKRLMGVSSTALLAIALVAFTGSALAGNGNGNGNGGGSSATPPANSAPGNSANAPGQQKKSSPTPSTSSHGNSGHMQNSPSQPGVKPANNTQKNTVAPATSNKTKLYGNGKTAGQIAQQHGYTGNLYGPGNSQPHKVTNCRGHSVDVHALKSRAASKGCATQTSGKTTKSSAKTTKSSAKTTKSSANTTTQAAPALTIVIPSLGQVTPVVVGGVLGASASAKSPTGGVLGAVAGAKARGGVLGAVASAKRHGKLPFTGFPVWVTLLIGLTLTAAGLGLRRYARATI